jgi:hypothetical protein
MTASVAPFGWGGGWSGHHAITQTGSLTKAPYGYSLAPTASAVATVTSGAGTGKVG